jgi:hypothetical protein
VSFRHEDAGTDFLACYLESPSVQDSSNKDQQNQYENVIAAMQKDLQVKVCEPPVLPAPQSLPDVDVVGLPSDRSLVEAREAVRQAERRERAALAELKRLHSESRNVELLKEQVSALEAKCARLSLTATASSVMESRVMALAKIVDKVNTLYAELSQLRNCNSASQPLLILADITQAEGTSAHTFTSGLAAAEGSLNGILATVKQLQHRGALMLNSVGDLQAKLSVCETAKETVEAEVASLRGQVRGDQLALSAAATKNLKQEHKCALLQQQVETMKALLESVEAERRAFPLPSAQLAAAQSMASVSVHLEKLAQNSQIVLDGAFDAMQTMSSKGAFDAMLAQIASLEAELAASRAETVALYGICEARSQDDQKEEQSAGIDTAAASKLLSQGLDPSAATVGGSRRASKILHLALNPTATVLRTMDEKQQQLVAALKEENAMLRTQVQSLTVAAKDASQIVGRKLEMTPLMSAGVPASPAGIPAPALLDVSAIHGSAVQDAANNLQMDVLRKRMKDVFKQHLSVIREAVYRLTGYKIDVPVSQKPNAPVDVILRSMYFDREDVRTRACMLFSVRWCLNPYVSAGFPTVPVETGRDHRAN